MEAKKKSEFQLLVDKMNFIPQDIRNEIALINKTAETSEVVGKK